MNQAMMQRRAGQRIAQAGGTATLSWTVQGIVDLTTGAPAAPSQQTCAVTVLAFPFRLRNMSSDTFEQSTEVLLRRRRFVIRADGLTRVPVVGDQITGWEGTVPWTIDGVAPMSIDGATTLWYTGTMRR